LKRDLALLQSRDDVDQVPQATAEAVQAPDDERVAGQQVLQAGVELRPGSDRPGPYGPKTIVKAMCLYALEVAERRLAGPYSEARARAYAGASEDL
jgi:hypothetical protein